MFSHIFKSPTQTATASKSSTSHLLVVSTVEVSMPTNVFGPSATAPATFGVNMPSHIPVCFLPDDGRVTVHAAPVIEMGVPVTVKLAVLVTLPAAVVTTSGPVWAPSGTMTDNSSPLATTTLTPATLPPNFTPTSPAKPV